VATIDELNTKLEQLKSQLESQRYFNYRHYGGNSGDYKYTASFDFGQNLKVGETGSGNSYQALTGTINGKSKDFRRQHYGSVFDAFGKYTATQQSMAQTQGQIDAINKAEKARVAEEERKRKEAEAAAKKAAKEAEDAAKKAAKEAEDAAKKAAEEAKKKQFEEDYRDKATGTGGTTDTGETATTQPPPSTYQELINQQLNNAKYINTDADFYAAARGTDGMANNTAITTDEKLMTAQGVLAGLGVPSVEAVTPTVKDGELLNTSANTTLTSATPIAGTSTADITGLSAAVPTVPTDPTLGQVAGTTQITPGINAMTAAQIQDTRRPQVDISQVEGTVSAGSQATAATQELDQRATVQYQLGELLGSIEEGKPMPAWAAPAVRKVAGVMQARGLGASSMAAAAMTQAVMESGIVIASQDANKYATIQLQNLNNQQQTALTNAAVVAGMDKANLSARLQGAVTNAQMLLATETKNLDARQQGATLSYNALTQAMFKDAAEDNARKQFNAKNELQVEEFFANLGSQVETANKNRVAATAQFNAGEINAQQQFNAAMRDNREKFNANMQFAVDQSNAQWRRQVNTAATAIQNETNRINVANQFNASQNALNNLWQKYRDNAAWNFQKTESYMQRQHEVGIMAMEFANTKELYTQQQKDNLALGIGNWIATWMAGSGTNQDTDSG